MCTQGAITYKFQPFSADAIGGKWAPLKAGRRRAIVTLIPPSAPGVGFVGFFVLFVLCCCLFSFAECCMAPFQTVWSRWRKERGRSDPMLSFIWGDVGREILWWKYWQCTFMGCLLWECVWIFVMCGVVVCEMGGLNVFMKRKVLIFIIRVIWNCRVL